MEFLQQNSFYHVGCQSYVLSQKYEIMVETVFI